MPADLTDDPPCYWAVASLIGRTETNTRPLVLVRNSTLPLIRAKSVWSLPIPTLRPACHLVPRWRAIMLPASTSSPPNIFSPRRCPAESRPLREDPPAFLCAIIGLRNSLALYLERIRDKIITCRCHFFLLFAFAAGFFSLAAGFAFDFSFFAAVLRAVGAPSSADVAAAAAPAGCSEAAAAGARLGRGCACLLGFLPSVKISVMRNSVNSWRWPILRREFLRRRFLKAMIFGPRACWRTSAATVAPATVGAPRLTLSPPTTRTSPNSTISPGSPLTLPTLSTSSAATRYCLPPVLNTANMFVPRSKPDVRVAARDRILPVCSADGRRDGGANGHIEHADRRRYDRPVSACQEMHTKRASSGWLFRRARW